jgi:hypothetical protein
MTSRTQRKDRATKRSADDFDSLYAELLRLFYEQEDRDKALKIAARLEAILESETDAAHSIRGDEVRSLIAELRGDLAEAVQRRQTEIRRILELQTSVLDARTREYVFRQYDYSDVSDRLDILATLYAEQGDLEHAVKVLHESRQFCELHEIPFDGQDLLDEYERARSSSP